MSQRPEDNFRRPSYLKLTRSEGNNGLPLVFGPVDTCMDTYIGCGICLQPISILSRDEPFIAVLLRLIVCWVEEFYSNLSHVIHTALIVSVDLGKVEDERGALDMAAIGQTVS